MMIVLAAFALGASLAFWLRARVDHMASFRAGFAAGISVSELSRQDQAREAATVDHAAVSA